VKSEREQFIRRLGVYLAGIAIGCVILGLFQQARQAEAQRQAAARKLGAVEAQAKPAQGDGKAGAGGAPQQVDAPR